MKKLSKVFALTTGIVGLFAAAATAADIPVKAPAVPVAVPFSWTGFYVGVNGGYARASGAHPVTVNETFATLPFFGPVDFGALEIAGGFGGVQGGVNAQFGHWVVGLEVDVQGAAIKDRSLFTYTPYLAPGGTLAVATKHTVTAFGTVRPRIGYAWDNTLFYATGGAAWGNIRHAFHGVDAFGFFTDDARSTSQFGIAVGGGIEHAFSSNFSAKVEYQYIDLGWMNHKVPELFGPGRVATAFSLATNTHTEFHTVRAGLNYRFGATPDGGALAKGPMVTKAPAVAARAPEEWSGLYFGGEWGWMWSDHDAYFPDGNPAAQIVGVAGQNFAPIDHSGFAGALVGFQHQFGRLVLGVEAGATTRLKSLSNPSEDLCPKQVVALFNCSARIDTIYTVGGRVGWSMGSWLPYVSGGYAEASFYGEATNRSLAPVGTRIIWWDDRTNGWYIGGGLDWAFAQGFALGIEYRHYEFNDKLAIARAVVGGVPGVALPNDNAIFSLAADTVALRLSYRFNVFGQRR